MRRGWCPTVHEPMPTGDGLLLRIKPPMGRLGSAQARLVGRLAAEAGNGIVELTGRGNLQLRGIRGAERAAAMLVEAGLAHADPAAERRRNVVVSPLAAHDPDVAPGTPALAAQAEALLVALPGLPAKFCIAVDGGGVVPLGFDGDVTLSLRHREERSDGLVGRFLYTPDAAFPERRVGFVPYRTGGLGAFGLALPFGETNAPALLLLAELAERFSDGVLCLGPRRTVWLGAVRDPDALRRRAGALIADPADPRLRIHACIGSRGCASGSVDARGDAARFARVPFEGTLHVSGCAKRCAHPRPATLTLIGENGRYRAERAA